MTPHTPYDPRETATEARLAKLRKVIAHRQPHLSIILENVHDEHNVAAVLRSCDAVGVKDIHLIYNGREVFPTFGKKTSGSARKWVEQYHYTSVEECMTQVRAKGMKIYTTKLSDNALSIYDLDLTQPTAILFGNEHSGVSEEALRYSDGNVVIPMVGLVESLNISVAAAVCLFEAYRQREKAGLYTQSLLSESERESLLINWLQR